MYRQRRFSRGILIALILMLVVSLGGYGLVTLRWIPPQPNIFAEIYADTEKNYHRYPSIQEMQDTRQKGDGFLSDELLGSVYYFYGDTGELKYYYDILSDFNFDTNEFSFKFSRKVNGIEIVELIEYSVQDRTLMRRIGANKESDKYLDFEYTRSFEYKRQILRESGITREDLEDYYRTVVEDYILTDWVQVYGSDFSPTDYGEVTIVDEWDRYFE